VVFAGSGLWLITTAWAFGEEIICPNDEETDPSHFAASFSAEYDSRYVFRGVNSLPGSGIATTDAEFEFQHFSLEIWQANGLSKSYDEFDFTFGYSRTIDCSWILGSFTLGGGYINYYTPNDDHLKLGYSDTQEFFVSAEWDIGSRYTVTLTYFYDFDKIRGGFIEPKFGYCFRGKNIAWRSTRTSSLRTICSTTRIVSLGTIFRPASKSFGKLTIP
jgi:hypothetical protein